MQHFTPKQYVKIDIANSFGLDKLDWDKRLEWFEANERDLLSKLREAENPAMFYAGVKAWEDIKAGRTTGYPISLDATSSGIQILSVLTGDRKAAIISNVLDAGHRSDAYQELYQAMVQKVVSSMQFSRADLKRSIMTAFYGSKAVPKEIFGEGQMLAAFFSTLEEETPFVWELNKAFLAMWDPKALKYSWIMPDNFHVHVKVMDQVQETVQFMSETFVTTRTENIAMAHGRSLGANITHSIDGLIVRELLRRCNYNREQVEGIKQLLKGEPGRFDPERVTQKTIMVNQLWDLYKKSGYLTARILDYLDEDTMHLVDLDKIQALIDSFPEKPFQIVPVHDCFRVHPNYGNDLRKQYNLQLSLIAESNMLQFVLTQILGKAIVIHKQANFSSDILNANYALS
jgi:hypothetical protein